MKPIRVLLADDHALVRAGFRMLLQQIAGVEIVAEASDGRDALRLIKSARPDIVIMDIAMPGLNGLEATAQVTREFPQVRVIMLSMYATPDYVVQALRAGAAGYLLKDAATAELELAVKAMARGETHLSSAVSKPVLDDYLRRIKGDDGGAPRDVSAPEVLTPRQREIVQLIAEGHTMKDIARRLHLSINTVNTHRRQLMERLDIHDKTGLTRYAIRMGLTVLDYYVLGKM